MYVQLFVDKTAFLEKKTNFLGIKQSTSVLVQIQKNLFFAEICCNFFLRFFAAKSWSKYTTFD